MLQHPNDTDTIAWQPDKRETYYESHDNPDASANSSKPKIKNYFSPSRIYCIETICAPCGVVIAWAKFPKAESPENILSFLEFVFPKSETRPDYICIDKACLVLRTLVKKTEQWNSWQKTSRFIVDAYHYINHRDNDVLY